MNLKERFIRILGRKQNAVNQSRQQRHYDAASKGRRLSDWYGANVSATQTIAPTLETLRGRSRVSMAKIIDPLAANKIDPPL